MRAARVVCRTPRDAVMFAVHCTFLAEGYVLLAAGDNVDPMMFQEKEEEPDDGLPKRKPDPHVGWNDMDDEYAFKYCALADYDNTAQAPAPAHVGAILKAIFIGNTLMCHSVRTEDGARAHHDPAAPLASSELPLGTHAKVVDEVAIAADPTLALADVAALVDIVRTTLVDPVRRRSIPDEREGGGDASRGEGSGVGGVDAGGPGARGGTGSAAGEGTGRLFDPYGPVPGVGGGGFPHERRFPHEFGSLGGFDGDPRFAPGRGPPESVNPDVEFGGAPDGFYPIAPGAGFYPIAPGAGGARGPPGWPGTGGAPRWNPDLGPPPEG